MHKTELFTNEGLQVCCMPFGLCNAPAAFQKLMNLIIDNFISEFVAIYPNDIVLYSEAY